MAEHEDNHSTRCSKDPFSSAVDRGVWERTVHVCLPPWSPAASLISSQSLCPLASFLQLSLLRVCSFPLVSYLTFLCTCQTLTGLSHFTSTFSLYPRLDVTFLISWWLLCCVTVGNWPLSRRGKNCYFCSNVISSPVIS